MVEANISVEEKRGSDCPYCKDALRDSEAVVSCKKCGTRLHAACAQENRRREELPDRAGTCTVLGCGGELEGAATRAPVERPKYVPLAPRPPVEADGYPWYQGPIGLILFFSPFFALAALDSAPKGVALAVLGVSVLVMLAVVIAVARSGRQ